MKAERMVAMVGLLRRPELTTIEVLAAELGVSRRTVVRDLAWLTDAGFEVDVIRGRHGGIRLAPGSRLDLDSLSQGELEQLRVAGLDEAQLASLGFAEQRKLLSLRVGARKSVSARSLSELVTVDNSSWFDDEPEVAMDDLLKALRQSRRWRIDYRPTGSVADRSYVVDPYGLLVKAGRWYLVADVESHPRLFNLSRLNQWRPTADPAVHREGENLASVAQALVSATRDRSEFEISATFPESEHSRALRMLGAKATSVETLEGGDIRLTIGCLHMQEVRDLLPFVDRIHDVRPDEARAVLERIMLDALAEGRL